MPPGKNSAHAEKSTGGRHAKAHLSIAEVAQREITGPARLMKAEELITERISSVCDCQHPIMFFETNLTPEEQEWVCLELGNGLRRSDNAQDIRNFLSRYPNVVVTALATAGAHITGEGSFWPVFFQLINVDERSDIVENHIRKHLNNWLNSCHLESFENTDLGSRRFVERALLHAGIPTAELHRVIDDANKLLEVDDDPEDGDREGKHLVGTYAASRDTSTLHRLSVLKPVLAEFMFARIVEYVHWTNVTDDWYNAEFEGTNGLPQKLFSELREYLNSPETVDPEPIAAKKAQAAPYIKIDIDLGTIDLVLPAAPDNGKACKWNVDLGYDNISVSPQYDYALNGWIETPIPISQPTAAIRTHNAENGSIHSLRLYDGEFPAIFLRSNSEILQNQTVISTNTFLVLAPDDVEFTGDSSSSPVGPTETWSFDNWIGWKVFLFEELTGVRTLTLSRPSTSTFTTRHIRSNNSHKVEWLDEDLTLKNVFGQNGQPVYYSSPRVKLPFDENAYWTKSLIYCSPLGDRTVIEQNEELSSTTGEPIAVFPDYYRDAWVGEYEVNLFDHGTLKERRTFNMAEGARVRLKYGSSASCSYRYPQTNIHDNGNTEVFITYESSGDKRTVSDFNGFSSIKPDAGQMAFTLTNPEGFELKAIVVPDTLEYAIENSGEPLKWVSRPSLIRKSQLRPGGKLKIRFPYAMSGKAEVYVAESLHSRGGQRAGKAMRFTPDIRRNRTIFEVPVSSILEAIDTARDIVVGIQWYPESPNTTYKKYKAAQKDRWVESWSAFKKKYDNWTWTYPSPLASTLFTASSSNYSGSVFVQEKDLVLSSPIRSSDNVQAIVWQMSTPDEEPAILDIKQQKTLLPALLRKAGPLVVDFSISRTGYRAEIPKTPTPNARVASSPQVDHRFMQKNLTWDQLAIIRNLSYRELQKASGPLITRTYHAISDDPRSSLERLGHSTVAPAVQPSLAIQFGLINHHFHATGSTQGEFNPSKWAGILGEINDIAKLCSREELDSISEKELKESVSYVEAAAGSDLAHRAVNDGFFAENHQCAELKEIFDDIQLDLLINDFDGIVAKLLDSEGKRKAADSVALRHSFSELVENRKQFEEVPQFEFLLRTSLQHRYTLTNSESSLRADLLYNFAIEITGNPDSLTPAQQWAWAPFVSFIFSDFCRFGAHLSNDSDEMFSQSQLFAWGKMARLIPTLTVYDLLWAEARFVTAR